MAQLALLVWGQQLVVLVPPGGVTRKGYKYSHQMTPIALWFELWPPGGANCISCKFGHQVATLPMTVLLTSSVGTEC